MLHERPEQLSIGMIFSGTWLKWKSVLIPGVSLTHQKIRVQESTEYHFYDTLPIYMYHYYHPLNLSHYISIKVISIVF